MSHLILVRHGQSRWNLSNKFTGWVDVPLSAKGIKEAYLNAEELKNYKFDIAFTSELVRAQETLLIIFSHQNKTGIFQHKNARSKWLKYSEKIEKNEIPIFHNIDLNERYYGKLQGMNKQLARKEFGEAIVFAWRRSFEVAPPGGESLKDVYKRILPYYKKNILKALRQKKEVLLVAHGNSLRALIKYLEDISDADIPHLELVTGKPIIYKYKAGKLKKISREFTYDRPIYWTVPKSKE